MAKSIILIPSRMAATRLPNKPLLKINNKSMIMHVYDKALESNIGDVFVATSDQIIFDEVKSNGGKSIITSDQHKTGTDRIADALSKIDTGDIDYVINLQGDEPFINIDAINNLISSFEDNTVKMASLMTSFNSFDEINNPNNVKVTVDKNNNAIFFSRSPIPEGENEIKKLNRHIGVYAFRKNTLINFSSLNRSKNEISQNLEGNRAIDNLIPIKMIKIDFHGISIDTEKDFIEAEKYLSKNA